MTNREILWESLLQTMHDFKNWMKLVFYCELQGCVGLVGLIIGVILSICDLPRYAYLREIRYSGGLTCGFDRLFSKYIWKKLMAFEIV